MSAWGGYLATLRLQAPRKIQKAPKTKTRCSFRSFMVLGLLGSRFRAFRV